MCVSSLITCNDSVTSDSNKNTDNEEDYSLVLPLRGKILVSIFSWGISDHITKGEEEVEKDKRGKKK